MSAECGEKGTLLHCSWECKLMQSLWRTVWKLLKKLKIELHKNQQFHSWVFIKGKKKKPKHIEKTYAPFSFIVVSFTIAKICK